MIRRFLHSYLSLYDMYVQEIFSNQQLEHPNLGKSIQGNWGQLLKISFEGFRKRFPIQKLDRPSGKDIVPPLHTSFLQIFSRVLTDVGSILKVSDKSVGSHISFLFCFGSGSLR